MLKPPDFGNIFNRQSVRISVALASGLQELYRISYLEDWNVGH